MSDSHDAQAVHAAANGPPLHAKLLVRLSWPVAIMLLVIFTLSLTLVALPIVVAPAGDVVQIAMAVAKGSGVVRTLALTIVVPAISLLSMLDKVNGSAAIAALSAIAGYVLGGTAASP